MRSAAQLGLDIGQLRTARVTREAGEASKRQVRLDLAWAEWQTAGQARLQGVRMLALADELAIARTSAAAAEKLFQATKRAAGRGDIAASELDGRRQALLDVTDKLRVAEARSRRGQRRPQQDARPAARDRADASPRRPIQ